ncbi:MAG: hypothetical protein AAGD32_17060 [Planctomycetota bacterium]
MSAPLDQLAADVAAFTGSELPRVLDGEAALLPDASVGDEPPYLVGFIGGKDVGKTSLANAIAGLELSRPIGHGEGTNRVIAWCHRAAEPTVRPLLETDAANAHTLSVHEHDPLLRQVLVDLPDIDSKYADHVELTKRMLRHMLFPLWVQSVEKYADQAPQKLLAAVAEGNDPANFVFVLNKADQLVDREGLEAAGELAADYAQRLQRLLDLPEPPDVFLVSAQRPDSYDLPRLREMLGTQKSVADVKRSRSLADQRRATSVLAWVDEQDLPAIAAKAERVREHADDLLAEEVVGPVTERALPMWLDDAATRARIAEPAVARRVRRWPLVNLIDAGATPLIALIRRNLSTHGGHVPDLDADGRPLADKLRASFAVLHEAHTEIGPLYRSQKLWEHNAADLAVADLRRRLSATTETVRNDLRNQKPGGSLLWPFRWLLTLGALLWFPILQPITEVLLRSTDPLSLTQWKEIALLAVSVISSEHLLQSAGFLAIYFVILWGTLRLTHTAAVMRRLSKTDTGLAPAIIHWARDLLSPLDRRSEQARSLLDRAGQLR